MNEIAEMADDLRGFAYSMTRNVDDAHDVAQEAMLRAVENFHQFERGTYLKGWLFTITRNVFLTSLRRRGYYQRYLDGTHDSAAWSEPSHEPEHESKLALRDAIRAINRLPLELRQVLDLVIFCDGSYAEAAEIMRTPVGTVKSRLSRARAALAEALA